MPRKRVASKLKNVSKHPDAWLLFWCGWCYNERLNGDPIFSNLAECRDYWQRNKERIIADQGTDIWVWHAFEEHDWEHCEYCNHRKIAEELTQIEADEKTKVLFDY